MRVSIGRAKGFLALVRAHFPRGRSHIREVRTISSPLSLEAESSPEREHFVWQAGRIRRVAGRSTSSDAVTLPWLHLHVDSITLLTLAGAKLRQTTQYGKRIFTFFSLKPMRFSDYPRISCVFAFRLIT